MGPVFDPEDRGKNELYEVADTKELCVCVCCFVVIVFAAGKTFDR